MALMLHHIFTATDSIGLNEQELGLFMQALRGPSYTPTDAPCSPVACVQDAVTLAGATGVSRIHLHTFGYYVLVLKSEHSDPVVSRNALLLAARVAADMAGLGEQVLSRDGLLAYASIRDAYGPDEMPGILRIDGYLVIIVPTYISQNVQKTAGLGDILSSTAFVADIF